MMGLLYMCTLHKHMHAWTPLSKYYYLELLTKRECFPYVSLPKWGVPYISQNGKWCLTTFEMFSDIYAAQKCHGPHAQWNPIIAHLIPSAVSSFKTTVALHLRNVKNETCLGNICPPSHKQQWHSLMNGQAGNISCRQISFEWERAALKVEHMVIYNAGWWSGVIWLRGKGQPEKCDLRAEGRPSCSGSSSQDACLIGG